jgi:hypothetical protein
MEIWKPAFCLILSIVESGIASLRAANPVGEFLATIFRQTSCGGSLLNEKAAFKQA